MPMHKPTQNFNSLTKKWSRRELNIYHYNEIERCSQREANVLILSSKNISYSVIQKLACNRMLRGVTVDRRRRGVRVSIIKIQERKKITSFFSHILLNKYLLHSKLDFPVQNSYCFFFFVSVQKPEILFFFSNWTHRLSRDKHFLSDQDELISVADETSIQHIFLYPWLDVLVLTKDPKHSSKIKEAQIIDE